MSRSDIINELAEKIHEDSDGHDVQAYLESYLHNLEADDICRFNELREAHTTEDTDEDDVIEEMAESMLEDADGEDKIGYIEDYLYSISGGQFKEYRKRYGL